MQRIKEKDTVMILTGKEKKKTGAVEKVLGDRVIVAGLNIVKRHQRGNPNQNKPASIINKNMSVHISNVTIVNKETGKTDKVLFKRDADGKKKLRLYKSDKKEIT